MCVLATNWSRVSTRILALVPHYGGRFPAIWMRPGVRSRRLEYLDATLESLGGFATHVVVGVQNNEDERNVQRLGRKIEVRRFSEVQPIFLPAQLCRTMQSAALEYDIVYYTEDDQALKLERGDIPARVREDESIFVAPHRLAPVPERFSYLSAIPGSDSHLARIVDYCGRRYAIENESVARPDDYDEELYVNPDTRSAYAGAFLCSSRFFRAIDFTFNEKLPTECTGGFDAFRVQGAKALKTKRVFDFFVLHLSGWEFYERLTAPETHGGEWTVQFADGREISGRPHRGSWKMGALEEWDVLPPENMVKQAGHEGMSVEVSGGTEAGASRLGAALASRCAKRSPR
jgi:hypothetical protein